MSIDYRAKFLDFFRKKGHVIIPSASLLPENDATVLFTTAGMQPLAPYLLGEPHPAGKRLANAQKCLRTGDIDEVGDNRHLTFFEMLGNWSLGDYFKNESIVWSWEFLTGAEWLNIAPDKIFVTVFSGSSEAPRDTEAEVIWQKLFQESGVDPKIDTPLAAGGRIFSYPAAGYLDYPENKNWWPPSAPTGPQGPDTEIFFDTGRAHDLKFGPFCHPNCDCGRFVEIWNNVFMQFERKNADEPLQPLAQKNVDTGMGLERLTALMENAPSVFESTLFRPIISSIEAATEKNYAADWETTRAMRIIADHVRSATFIIGDEQGVVPSNLDQGYIVRRLLRRAVRYGYALGKREPFLADIAETVIKNFGAAYSELKTNYDRIISAITAEEEKFFVTLARGVRAMEVLRRQLQEFGNALDRMAAGAIDDSALREALQRAAKSDWINVPELIHAILAERDTWSVPVLVSRVRDQFSITGKFLFSLYTTDGLPLEMVKEFLLSDDEGRPIIYVIPIRFDEKGFAEEFKKHQELSRASGEQKFSGGLADSSANCTRLHTATHLLQAALRRVLGEHVAQKGSNITPERLRFDFAHHEKMTAEQLRAVEDWVNDKIKKDLPVQLIMTTVEQAADLGAIGLFKEKYASLGEQVKLYCVGNGELGRVSSEICGGPHTTRTGELGHFKILKEEAVSAGVRRLKAVLE